jgi:uncharacterized protein (TIGR02145 family)
MKRKLFWMLAVAGLTLSAACNIKDYEEPTSDSTLSIPGNVINAVATGGDYAIDVTSNGTWAASVSAGADWCTLDNASGTGNGSIRVAVGENIALAPRNTTVTIAIKGAVIKQVAIKQASADTLLRVEPADLGAVNSMAGTYSAEVISNCPWTAAVNTEASAWCSVTPASGDGREPVSVMVTPNPGAQRAATITFATVSGGLTAQLVITQNMDAFGVDPTSITALVAAQTYPVSVTTLNPSTTWTADLAPATAVSWCSIAPAAGTGNGTINVNVVENTSGASRAATLTVTSEGASKTVVITQNEPTLLLSRTSLSVMSTAADYPINITANVSWTASVSPGAGWCTVTPASGTGNGTLTVRVTENAAAARSATVTVTGNGLSRTLPVTQLEAGLGVSINGITWASKNVGAADAFVDNPGESGKLYQWDNNTAHDYGVGTGWATSASGATVWSAGSDPCPDGWRVPTKAEFDNSLLSSPKRWVAASSDNWNKAGMWIGPNAASATAVNPGQAIFLPVTGYATPPALFGNFTFAGQDTHGRYWLAEQSALSTASYFEWYSGAESDASYATGSVVKRAGNAIRCVSE